jgi:DNA-binding GntR family transcriptional regulator
MARPLRDQAAELLGQEIAAGKLPPGSRLNERDIAVRFGMSRTPAREVLLQLSSAGLVRIEPRQGAVVLNLSPQEIVSMVEILVALEGEAVGLATRRMEPHERHEIAETYRLATDGVERMSSEGYSEANHRFHQAIYVGSRNPLLTAEIKKLRARLAPYFHYSFVHEGRLRSSHAEHKEILEAIQAVDEDAAMRAMRRHILNGGNLFADMLSRLTYEPA